MIGYYRLLPRRLYSARSRAGLSPLRLLLLLLSLPTVPFSSRCREPASRAPLARKPFFFFFVLSFFRFCILFSFVSSFLLTYEALQNGTHSRRPKGESRRRGSPLPALPLIVFALAFKAFFESRRRRRRRRRRRCRRRRCCRHVPLVREASRYIAWPGFNVGVAAHSCLLSLLLRSFSIPRSLARSLRLCSTNST